MTDTPNEPVKAWALRKDGKIIGLTLDQVLATHWRKSFKLSGHYSVVPVTIAKGQADE